jgi:hypothetical protein
MKQIRRMLLTMIVAVLALAQPALAELPDPVRFGVRMEFGDITQAREWLDAGLDPDFLADRIGTGLMIAAWQGNIPLMELFVARGADVNRTNAVGESALLHAAWRGNLEAVKWLMAHGAKVNREPLQWTALHYAVFAGHDEVAQYLIEHGADVNARSTNGSSVLMMAAYEGHEDLARKLVALGADRSVKNDRGDGVLEWAMKYKHFGIARLASDPQQFATAANLPKEHWGEPVRSVSVAKAQAPAATGELERLLSVRSALAARGMTEAVKKVDLQIAALRAKPDVDKGRAASRELERLLSVRSILASRGMTSAVARLDRQIAALRAKPEVENLPPAVLEISASRRAPREQKARLITEHRTN